MSTHPRFPSFRLTFVAIVFLAEHGRSWRVEVD
jgi:hypothetical protein